MKTKIYFLLIMVLMQTAIAGAGAIRNLPGFASTVYGANDDGTYPCVGPDDGIPPGTPITVPIGFNINFYGVTFSNLYVNNNGNVTFDQPLGDFTPFGLANTATEIVAPFFSDVDTRAGNVVTFGNDIVDGHAAFGVNWIDVGYYNANVDKLNSFQVVLIERSDRNPGDFDIEFNYDQIQWETGDASGGVDGLGGFSAVAGFSSGSGQPGTSFQLAGSGIPGEFLDSNPGGLTQGFLNTNVLGRYLIPIVNLTNKVLNVERFSQGDPRWANTTYDNSDSNIQALGCALSCLAMALNYEGVATDPGALNALMNDNNDFDGTGVNWGPATRDASGDTLEFHAYRTSDRQYLSQTLANGFPVIVEVSNAQGGSHFVLVTGEQNGQFLINDPGHVDATNLNYYNNEFETRGYVGDPPGDISELDVTVGNIADMLIVDPHGRRIGCDPASGLILDEIPQAVHFSDNIEASDLTGAPGTNTARTVEIYQPLAGTYQIFLVGSNAGHYQLSLRSFAHDGTPGPPLILQGMKTSGGIASSQVSFGPAGVVAQPFTNECPWSASPTNGAIPLSVQFTAANIDAGGNPITNWHWNFGDGSTATGQNPGHVYTNGGTFFPSLTALNNTGSTTISFGPSIFIPTVQYTASPTNGPPPLTVQFTAANQDSGGNPITSWNWFFGDGTASTEQNPSHTYTTASVFKVSLIATNSNGLEVSGVGPSAVAAANSLVFNGGFETGDFAGWTLVDDSEDSFVDDGTGTGITPHSGTYLAALGPVGSLGYLSQVLNTVPGQSYLLSLWLNDPDGLTPSEFQVNWNGSTLSDQLDMSASAGWTNLQFTVTAAGTNSVLQIGSRDDQSYLGLDDVSVQAVSVIGPRLTIIVSGVHAVLMWPTNATGYTLQSATNLGPAAVWSAVSPAPVVLNGQNAVSNGIGGKQMFYRLIQ